MFHTASSHGRPALHLFAGLGVALLASLAAVPALAGPVAKSHVSINVHAGPAVDYPRVMRLPAHVRLQVQGCLPDFEWCDVSTGRHRGWVRGAALGIDVGGDYQPIQVIGPAIGLPVVHFALGPYWNTYYHDQPWFNDPRFAAEINAYRIRHQHGNTVIEYERRWQATPRYRQYPPPTVYYEEPPVYVVPSPGYRPPRPVHGPSPYEPPIFIPPSKRVLPGYPHQQVPVYPPPGHIRQPPAFRPAPVPQPVDPGNLPGYQPGSHAYPPGAIIQSNPAAGGSRMLK